MMNNEILDAAEQAPARDEARLRKLHLRGKIFAAAAALLWLPLQYILYAYNLVNFTEATGWDTEYARLFFISLLCLGALTFLISSLYYARYNYINAKTSPISRAALQLILFFAAIGLSSTSYALYENAQAQDFFEPLGFRRGNTTAEFGFILCCICCAISVSFLISMFASIAGYRVGQTIRPHLPPL